MMMVLQRFDTDSGLAHHCFMVLDLNLIDLIECVMVVDCVGTWCEPNGTKNNIEV